MQSRLITTLRVPVFAFIAVEGLRERRRKENITLFPSYVSSLVCERGQKWCKSSWEIISLIFNYFLSFFLSSFPLLLMLAYYLHLPFSLKSYKGNFLSLSFPYILLTKPNIQITTFPRVSLPLKFPFLSLIIQQFQELTRNHRLPYSQTKQAIWILLDTIG